MLSASEIANYKCSWVDGSVYKVFSKYIPYAIIGKWEFITMLKVAHKITMNQHDLQKYPEEQWRKGKGKAVPLQACSGPEGSRKLRFPNF